MFNLTLNLLSWSFESPYCVRTRGEISRTTSSWPVMLYQLGRLSPPNASYDVFLHLAVGKVISHCKMPKGEVRCSLSVLLFIFIPNFHKHVDKPCYIGRVIGSNRLGSNKVIFTGSYRMLVKSARAISWKELLICILRYYAYF